MIASLMGNVSLLVYVAIMVYYLEQFIDCPSCHATSGRTSVAGTVHTF